MGFTSGVQRAVTVDRKMKLAIMFVLLGCAFLAIAEQTSFVSENDSMEWSASVMWQSIQEAVLAGVETLREKLSKSGIVDDVEKRFLRAQEKVNENVETVQKKLSESNVVGKVKEEVERAEEGHRKC